MRNESFMQGTNFVFRQKGGSAVKHVGRAVFFACLTALLLLGMRQLVVAPESASAESSPAPPGIPAVMTAALPAPESAAASASTAQEALHRPVALPAHPPMPVLTRADIGIAMGAMGSDAAIEAADVVLMDDDPMKISKAVKISRKCLRIVHENIVFAIGIKLACLLLVAIGKANMWAAIFADVGVMVLAVLNAIRALMVKKL